MPDVTGFCELVTLKRDTGRSFHALFPPQEVLLEPREIHYRGMQNPSTALKKPSEILFQRAYQFCFVQAVVFQTAA
jgi:hypothetical protein